MTVKYNTRGAWVAAALLNLALITTATASAPLFTLRHTFQDPSPAPETAFGWSLALDGNRVLVGAPQDDTQGTNVGQVHLFDAASGALLRTFDDPTATSGDAFGSGVGLDGNRVLIGAMWDDTHGVDVGQAHLFDVNSGTLLQSYNDPTPTTADWFGLFMALDGDRVLVGAPKDDTQGAEAGQAHLFDADNGSLLHTFDDPTPTAGDNFGARAVALDGNRALIGAFADDTQGTNVGQAHLFDTVSGALLHTFDDPNVTGEDSFGSGVALDGNRVLIGASYDNTQGNDVGQAHLFDASGALLRTFDDPTPYVTGRDRFGHNVAIDGNSIVIGDPGGHGSPHHVGQAHLFHATTGALLHTFDDPAADWEGRFGWSLALQGNRVLLGAWGTDDGRGRAYLFTPTCDFNGDAVCDIADLNAMLAEGPIAPGVPVTPGVNDQFDLTGEGRINIADLDQWLADAATINGLAPPYRRGDVNLDGMVDVIDFNLWNSHKFTSSLLWDEGDVTGDGVVDVADFNRWNGNKFTSSDGVTAVPEPSIWILLLAATLLWRANPVRR